MQTSADIVFINNEKILAGWKNIKETRQFADSDNPGGKMPYITPFYSEVYSLTPRSYVYGVVEKCGRCSRRVRVMEDRKQWKRFEEYGDKLQKEIEDGVKNNKDFPIKKDLLDKGVCCYLDVTFKRKTPADEDNLVKPFKDVLADVFFEHEDKRGDDKYIINRRSEVEVDENLSPNREGVLFVLTPVYKLAIKNVATIEAGKNLDGLNELRREYEKAYPLQEKPEKWEGAMQMVETNFGVFFDDLPGKSHGGTEFYGEAKLYRAEPGFKWEDHIGKTVGGVMIYERSACWWVNKRKIWLPDKSSIESLEALKTHWGA